MALRTSAHRTSLHAGSSWSAGAALPPVRQTHMKRESLSGSPAAAFTPRAAAASFYFVPPATIACQFIIAFHNIR